MHNRKKRKIDMDANSVITAFLVSSNQYVLQQNENNLMQLQRHLEIIVCLTTTPSDLGYFQSGNPLSSQCITHILNLLLDSNVKCTLIPRVLSVLQNLSKCAQLNKNLQSVFHAHSAISVFLQHYGCDLKDPIVLQSLDLLENLTYNIHIDYLESHLENLINILLKLIDTESCQLLKTSLRILSNLTRHNVNIQNYICSLPNAKQYVRKIIAMLNTEEPKALIHVLSILANITPNYPIGDKLWTNEHLMNTFKVIIKLLSDSDETCALAALDLFLDLINVPKYQTCFLKSPYLNNFFKKIPKILTNDENNHAVLHLEILNSLVQISDCREKVCSALSMSDPCSDDQSLEFNCVIFHPKLVQWCTEKDVHKKVTKLSLKLLKNIIIFHSGGNFDRIKNSTKDIVKFLLENLDVPLVAETNELDVTLEAYIVVFEILILLCQKSDLKPFIKKYINIETCEKIAAMLLSLCKTDNCDGYVSCIELFLMVLEVISMIENDVPDSEKLSCKILQNEQAMQYLAYALSCNNNVSVKRGLLLISLIKNDSSLVDLSKCLLHRNSKHSHLSDSSYISDNGLKPIQTNNRNTNDSFEKQIDSLLIKIDEGLSMKEFKGSEIMDLYEHKIAILTRKEQELQSYIDVKSAALQKADQIMTQYKCRQADSDAEALRLRTMIKDYESRCEKAIVQFQEAQKKFRKQKEELDVALCKVKEYEQNEKEQNELMQTQMNRQYEQKKVFEEEKARLFELLHSKDCEKKVLANQIQQMEEDIKLKNKAFEALEDSKDELLKKVEENKKTVEKMKLNFDQKQSSFEKALESAQCTILSLEEKCEKLTDEMNTKVEKSNQRILELEAEIDVQREQLKLKDSKITDLIESVEKLNSQLSEVTCSFKDAELSNEKLKASLEEIETKNAKIEKNVKMLEVLCKRYETSIEYKDNENRSLTEKLESTRQQCEKTVEEKEKQINNMIAELEKYKYLTGMINDLTSGKIPPKPEK